MTEQGNHFLTSGTRIAEYRIERLLGEGGFGLTYLAFDENLEKQVAIKEYLPIDFAIRSTDATVYPRTESTKEAFEWGLNAFINEARTLARFQNPYIVQVYRYFDANGTAYIVMEYVEGLTLRKSIRESGKLDQNQLMPILLPIMEGLVDVHKAEILHRDIKPENILIRENGKPVLIDFGAARQALGAKSRSITTIITPGYAPIEQYSSKAKVGPWSDIYALGAVAYFCLTQVKPEDASDRVVDDQLRPLTEIARQQGSQAFLAAIDKALSVTPSDRPQTLEEWANMLQAGETWEAPAGEDLLLAKRSQDQTTKAGSDGTRVMPKKEAEATRLAGSEQAATLARLSTGVGSKAESRRRKPSSMLWGMGGLLVLIAAIFIGVVVKPELLPLPWNKEALVKDDGGKQAPVITDKEIPEPGPKQDNSDKTPQPTPVATYPLYVTTEPPDASIKLSGEQPDYISGIELPAGEYDLRISLGGYKTITTSISILDREVRQHFELERAISTAEILAYERAGKSRKVEDLEAYIGQYPDGAYIEEVRVWLEQARQEIAVREEERARLERLEKERLAKLEQERRVKQEQELRAKLEQELRAKQEQERKAREAQQNWANCNPLPNRAASLTGRAYFDTGNTAGNFTLKLGRFTVQPNAIRKIGASDPYRSLCATSSCYEIRGSFGRQSYTYMTGGTITNRGEACFYYFEEKPHVIRIQ